MGAPAGQPRRGRGRPKQSDGRQTSQALLDAATEVCAEWGFERTTLTRIAARAGLSSTALYNHFATKEDLLYAAAVQGLERITELSAKLTTRGDVAPALASAYLHPDMKATRRLLVEVHLASNRDERLAVLLADWHRDWTRVLRKQLHDDDPNPQATIKTLFLLLLGLCHFDDLPAVRASASAVASTADEILRLLPAYRVP